MARKRKAESKVEEEPITEAPTEGNSSKVEESSASVAPPGYLVEVAKSARTDCKKCEKRIEKGEIRIGIIGEVETSSLDGFDQLDPASKKAVCKRIEVTRNEIDPEFVAVDPEEIVRSNWTESKEPCGDMLMPLLPYQKEGLAWMLHQENSDSLGGILADEMGMGKTIQAIALMLENRPLVDAPVGCSRERLKEFLKQRDAQQKRWNEVGASHDVGTEVKDLEKGGTLLVLPTVAVRQWQSEIARFTREGSLSVTVYHGSNRKSSTAKYLSDYDIVITSYKILEIEYRKATAGCKVTCKICQKKFYPDKLRVHRKYFCGESAQLTAAQAKTERKAKSSATAGVNAEHDSDSDEEDEIDRQKRLIKNMKSSTAQKPSLGKKAAKKSALGKTNPEGPASSEDEVDKQKRLIKEMKASADKKLTKKAGSKPSPVTKASQAKASTRTKAPSPTDSAEKSEGSDDDVDGSRRSSARLMGTVAPKYVAADIDSSSENSSVELPPNKKKRRSLIVEDSEEEGHFESPPKYRVSSKSSTKIAKSKSIKTKRGGKQSRKTSRRTNSDDSFSEPFDSSEASESEDSSVSSDEASPSRSSSSRKKSKSPKPLTSADRGRGMAKLNPRAEPTRSSPFSVAAKDVVDNSDDSEVERDIEEALRVYNKSKDSAADSILHKLNWFRIILDEAHMVKDRSTSTARAVFHLISLYKWCLTGTPLQNRVGELYSLIRFLRQDPHAYYYCKSAECTCKSLHYRFTKGKCDECGHTVMLHFCHFNKHILNPIKRCGYVGDGKKAMLKLKEQILDESLLRRTKSSRADDIQLPPRIVRVRMDLCDEREDDFYQALYTQSRAQFDTYVQSGTVLNNYAHIFDILIRLRQAVDHPYMVIHSETQKHTIPIELTGSNGRDSAFDSTSSLFVEPIVEGRRGGKKKAAKKGGGHSTEEVSLCGLCGDPPEVSLKAACGDVFCKYCITDYMTTVGTAPSSVDGPPASAAGKKSAKKPVVPIGPDDDDSVNQKSRKRGRSSQPPLSVITCPVCSEPLTINLCPEGEELDLEDAPEKKKNGNSVWDPNARRRKSILDKINLDLFQSSTKLEALMEELHLMTTRDISAKAIVFSQFVNMLDLCEYRIKRGGMDCVKLTGSMNIDQRDAALTAFKTDHNVRVLLISLKAGGVALNLTVASHIFLMDPWWNPAAEMQAIDRTHRIGQHKAIYATRFILANTIEERILSLQEKKKLVFDSTVGGDSSSLTKLTVDDMRFLFQ